MRALNHLLIVVAAAFGLWVGSASADSGQTASLPPVADFTKPATYQNLRISPSGDLLAATVRKDDFEGVAILKRATLEPVMAHQYGDDFEIFGMEWATDRVLLISPGIRLPSRTDFVFPTGEILALNIKNQRSELLYGFRAGQQQTSTHFKRRESTSAAATLVNILPDQPNHVLIQTRPFGSRPGVTQLQRLDVRNGKLRVVGKSEDSRSWFVTNSQGKLLARARFDTANDLHVERRIKNGYDLLFSSSKSDGYVLPGPAVELATERAKGSKESATSPSSAFYAFDNRARATSAVAIVTLDGSTSVLHQESNVEPDRFLTNRAGTVWGVRYDGIFPDYYYPDSKHPVAHMHKRLAKTFPKEDVEFTSFSDDDQFTIAFVHGDTNPGRFYLVDLKAGSVVELLDSRPWLDTAQLSEMQPVEVTARDGQKVVAMLTIPKVTRRKTPPPAVVLVHGGPHGVYDRWGFLSMCFPASYLYQLK